MEKTKGMKHYSEYLTYDSPSMKTRKNDKFVLTILVSIFLTGLCIGLLAGNFINEYKMNKIYPQMQEVIDLNKQILEQNRQLIELREKALDEPVVQTWTPEPIYNFSEDEIFLLAQLLCGQAGKDGDGEYDFETQIATGNIEWSEINKVLEVVMNRVLTPGVYADNVKDVVLQPGAFVVMPKNLNTTPSIEVIETVRYWTDAFNSPEYVPSIPDDHYWFSGSRGGNITRDSWR